MIQTKLFRKHFAIAAFIVLSFVTLGTTLSVFTIKNIMRRPPAHHPSVFFSHLIKKMDPQDPVSGLKKLQELDSSEMPFNFFILDENGKLLYGTNLDPLPPLPQLNDSLDHITNYRLVKMDYTPTRYLWLQFNPSKGLSAMPHVLFPVTFFVLVIMVLAGVGLAIFLIFRSLHEQIIIADNVISELQKGNLKARFPIIRRDEIGRAMERFNRMAEEIEQLVERLQSAEKSRNFLLQELAHDLRTPIASIRNLLETLFAQSKLTGPMQELFELAVKETDYISRLVEDLLLLAQVSEPKYKTPQKPLDLISLLREEGESMALKHMNKIEFSFHSSIKEALVLGDEQLMLRLIRNALENAFSFAKSKVEIKIDKINNDKFYFHVLDDGPGFSEKAIKQFGERSSQRTVIKTQNGRLSLGLGSVIMKTVIQLHRGEMHVTNQPTGGAIIEFTLPSGFMP